MISPETGSDERWARSQYVNKYSAAYWGTTFVREMSKLSPEEEQKKLKAAES